MVTIAAIDLKHYQKSLCTVTVLVDSQVSDRCPWATCFSWPHQNAVDM